MKEHAHTVDSGERVSVVSTDDPVATWPRSSDGRYICSPDRPMPTEHRATFGGSARWIHTDTKDVGECYDGCCDRIECSACGVRWRSGGGCR